MTEPVRPLELLERLVAADVRFVVVGGLAVNAWGYLRGTQDVDIVPDPAVENLDRLADLLEEMDGRVEVADGRLAASARLDADAGTVNVGGVSVRVCSLPALLEIKRASTRPRDRDDVEALEAAQEETSG